MIKLNRRGSVLVHVLVTGVIVAFLAAGLLRMVLMNYIAVDRATKSARNRKEAEAMLQRALTYWNESNLVCSDINPPNPLYRIKCFGPVGVCSCICANPTPLSFPRIEVTGGGPPPCVVTIISSDPL